MLLTELVETSMWQVVTSYFKDVNLFFHITQGCQTGYNVSES